MESRIKTVRISTIFTAVLVVSAIILGYWLYTIINYTPAQISTSDEAKIEINTKLYDEIKNPPSYGTEVSLDEPGYGRVNPFSYFKDVPSLDENSENKTQITPEDTSPTS